eukprot:scaffold836_cov123-Isochrysis_galbana.AAC.4
MGEKAMLPRTRMHWTSSSITTNNHPPWPCVAIIVVATAKKQKAATGAGDTPRPSPMTEEPLLWAFVWHPPLSRKTSD